MAGNSLPDLDAAVAGLSRLLTRSRKLDEELREKAPGVMDGELDILRNLDASIGGCNQAACPLHKAEGDDHGESLQNSSGRWDRSCWRSSRSFLCRSRTLMRARTGWNGAIPGASRSSLNSDGKDAKFTTYKKDQHIRRQGARFSCLEQGAGGC